VRHHKDRATYSGRDANHPRFSPSTSQSRCPFLADLRITQGDLNCLVSCQIVRASVGVPRTKASAHSAPSVFTGGRIWGPQHQTRASLTYSQLAHGRLVAPQGWLQELLQRLKPLQLSPDRHPKPHQSHPSSPECPARE